MARGRRLGKRIVGKQMVPVCARARGRDSKEERLAERIGLCKISERMTWMKQPVFERTN